MYLIEAYVTNASLNINHPFTYYSENDIEKYLRVRVVFNNAYTSALVVKCTYSNETKQEFEAKNGYKLNDVLEIIDESPIINDELYELALWLSKTTISPFIACLNAMLPKTLKTSKNISGPVKEKYIIKNDLIDGLTSRQIEIYNSLNDDMLLSDARKLSVSIVNKLIEKNVLTILEKEKEYKNNIIDQTSFKQLTKQQEVVYNSFLKTDKLVSLLFGVTGSGKTEVYLHLSRYYLNQGKEILILVPEISLTPQMIQRVKQRFSDVVFYHSELNDQERYEQYQRIKSGKVKIVVGTRSAIFLPFHNLGLIIIDEEHDSSYKQDNTPTYHVKNVAIKRAMSFNAKVLLASATPSLESYSRALKKEYELLKLESRISNNFAQIEIVDLNEEIKSKHSYIITNSLKNELDICLNNNKQAIILLNRRGYSPIVKCGNCGSTLMCNDCDIPLTYHKDENVLKCHQCSRTYKLTKYCTTCNSNNLLFYGFGTKKVEEELNKLYPNYVIERMDKDSTIKKGSHQEILERFEKHKIDILIGTQMISKGLDYPDVTLVGILNADAGLMHQDYNSSKLTFDLLMQASGRSGRANDIGKVIIQAFNTEHYAIKATLLQDYRYFYNIEMNYRSKTSYPPYSHIVEIIIDDANPFRLKKSLDYLTDKINKLPFKTYKPCSLNKIQKKSRYRILIIDKDLIKLLDSLHIIINEYLYNSKMSHIKVDIDPLYLE